jgi:hypothetical protein
MTTALYVKDGGQKYHKVDPDKKGKTLLGREVHVTECGGTIMCVCPAEELSSPPAGLCELCILDPSEEMKKKFRPRHYT